MQKILLHLFLASVKIYRHSTPPSTPLYYRLSINLIEQQPSVPLSSHLATTYVLILYESTF